MNEEANKGVIWLVVALLIIGGGFYLWQAKENPRPSPGEENQPTDTIDQAELTEYFQSKDLGFAMMLPAGYLADERPDGVLVVAEPTEDVPEPEPEFQVQVTDGNLGDFRVGSGITLLSDEEVVINGMKGRKFVITAEELPEGTKCDFYSFEDRGAVYEFSEYLCRHSRIFEPVLNTFELVWEK